MNSQKKIYTNNMIVCVQIKYDIKEQQDIVMDGENANVDPLPKNKLLQKYSIMHMGVSGNDTIIHQKRYYFNDVEKING